MARRREPAARDSLVRRYVVVVVIVALGAIGVLWWQQSDRETDTPELSYEVVSSFPHDPVAFTQGLIVVGDRLYESTGRKGQSSIRILDIESGEIIDRLNLDDDLFGEGLTLWDGHLIQLTWRDQVILFVDPETLEIVSRRDYPREAWGLTHDGIHLIISDGTPTLRFLDPETFEVTRTIEVRLDGRRLNKLNELEYVDGHIYANVWFKDYIVKISPESGEVVARLDLHGLWPEGEPRDRDAVLNGIAYDATEDRWFVTGKLWPRVFEIRITE